MTILKYIIYAPILLTILGKPTEIYAQDGAIDMTGMLIYSQEPSMMEAANENIQNTVNSNILKKNSSSVELILTNKLSYTASRSRTRANLANFVSKTRANDPASAAKMEALFASTDIIGQIGSALAPMGLRTDNAADAYAVYWISAWKASRGDSSTADADTYQAASAQAARALSSAPEFAKATDAMKQEMSEAYLVQAALIDASMETFASAPVMMAKLGASVKQGAKASGLDLDAMTLTSEGFKPSGKKRGDASDTAGDMPGAEPDTQLASATTPASGDSGLSAGTVALMAVAGTVGTAGVYAIGKASAKKA